MIQTVLVILTLGAAVAYLIWEAYKKFFKKDAACEGCAFHPDKHGS